MNWKPKYTITDKLLSTMREMGKAIGEIKSFGITQKALARLELEARELSSYASTSIEGNPLLLTNLSCYSHFTGLTTVGLRLRL